MTLAEMLAAYLPDPRKPKVPRGKQPHATLPPLVVTAETPYERAAREYDLAAQLENLPASVSDRFDAARSRQGQPVSTRSGNPSLPELRRQEARPDAFAPPRRASLPPAFAAPWQTDREATQSGVGPDERTLMSPTVRALEQNRRDRLQAERSRPALGRAAQSAAESFSDALTAGYVHPIGEHLAAALPGVSLDEAREANRLRREEEAATATTGTRAAGLIGGLAGAGVQYGALAKGAGLFARARPAMRAVAATRGGQMLAQGGMMAALGGASYSPDPLTARQRLERALVSGAQGATFGVVLPGARKPAESSALDGFVRPSSRRARGTSRAMETAADQPITNMQGEVPAESGARPDTNVFGVGEGTTSLPRPEPSYDGVGRFRPAEPLGPSSARTVRDPAGTEAERLAAAALRYNGRVVEGEIHAAALNDGVDRGIIPEEMADAYGVRPVPIEEGFTTTHGRFVDRQLARRLAAQQQQLTASATQDGRAWLDANDVLDYAEPDLPPIESQPWSVPEQHAYYAGQLRHAGADAAAAEEAARRIVALPENSAERAALYERERDAAVTAGLRARLTASGVLPPDAPEPIASSARSVRAPEQPEHVVAPSLLFEDGRRFDSTNGHHGGALDDAQRHYGFADEATMDLEGPSWEAGFTTDRGRFVRSREEVSRMHGLPQSHATSEHLAAAGVPGFRVRAPEAVEAPREHVAAAGIDYGDGEIFAGSMHGEAYGRSGEQDGGSHGFITNTGRFITREEAAGMEHAHAAWTDGAPRGDITAGEIPNLDDVEPSDLDEIEELARDRWRSDQAAWNAAHGEPPAPRSPVDRLTGGATSGVTGLNTMTGILGAGVGATHGATDKDDPLGQALAQGALGFVAGYAGPTLARRALYGREGALPEWEPSDPGMYGLQAQLSKGESVAFPHGSNPARSAELAVRGGRFVLTETEGAGSRVREYPSLDEMLHAARGRGYGVPYEGRGASSAPFSLTQDEANNASLTASAGDGATGTPPNLFRAPKGEPLPLPPMHPDLTAGAIEPAWREVSARYPRLAREVRGIDALPPTSSLLVDSRASFDPETGILAVPVDNPHVSAGVVYHELTHAAQAARRRSAATYEEALRDEHFAHRAENTYDRRARPGSQIPAGTRIAAGAGIGAGYGAATGETDEDRAYRALRYGAVGAFLGNAAPDIVGTTRRVLGSNRGALGDDTGQGMRRGQLPLSWLEDTMPTEYARNRSLTRAYIQGMEAGGKGLAGDFNPHAEGTPEFEAADAGWRSMQPKEARVRPSRRSDADSARRAAIRLPDGSVVEGTDHGSAVNNAVDSGALPPSIMDVHHEEWPQHFETGFVNPDGAFVGKLPQPQEAGAVNGYVAEPIGGGRFKVWNPETGHVAEERIGGIGARRTAEALARRMAPSGAANTAILRGISGAGIGGAVGYATGDDENRAGRALAGAVAGAGLALAPEVLQSVRRVTSGEVGAVPNDPERLLYDALNRKGAPAENLTRDLYALASGEMEPADFARTYGIRRKVAANYAEHARSFASPEGSSPLDSDEAAYGSVSREGRQGFEYQQAPEPSQMDGQPDDGFLPPDAPDRRFGSGNGQVGMDLFRASAGKRLGGALGGAAGGAAFGAVSDDEDRVRGALKFGAIGAGLGAMSPEAIPVVRRAEMLMSVAGRARDLFDNVAVMAPMETTSSAIGTLADMMPGQPGGRTLAFSARGTLRAARLGATEGVGDMGRAIVGRPGASRASRVASEAASASVEHADRVVFSNPILDALVRLPGRFAGSIDRPAAVYAYERSMANQAKVIALNERLSGTLPEGISFRERRAQLLKTPTAEMEALAASEVADATFTNKSVGGRLLEGMRNATYGDAKKGLPDLPVARVAIDINNPFRRVPGASVGKVAEYSPLGLGKVAYDSFTLHALAKAGADPALIAAARRSRNMTVGRVATGATSIAAGIALASQGLMTGIHVPQELKDDGAGPMSIKFAGRWWPLWMVPPAGPLMGVGAEVYHRGTADAVRGLGQNLAEGTFLRGTRDVDKALSSESGGESYGERLAGSFVPPIVGQVAHVIDPVQRKPDGVVQSVEARIPFASRNVPARVDALGTDQQETASLPGRIGLSLFDGVHSVPSRGRTSPVVAELDRIGVAVPPLRRTAGETQTAYRNRQRLVGRAVEQTLSSVMLSRREPKTLPVIPHETIDEHKNRLGKTVERWWAYQHADEYARNLIAKDPAYRTSTPTFIANGRRKLIVERVARDLKDRFTTARKRTAQATAPARRDARP